MPRGVRLQGAVGGARRETYREREKISKLNGIGARRRQRAQDQVSITRLA